MAGHQIDTLPVETGCRLNKSDSMSSYGSPITFTARTASTDTIDGQAAAMDRLPSTASMEGLAGSLQTGAVGPQTGAVGPQTGAVGPQTGAVGPQTSAVGPQTSAVGPQTSAVGPQTSAVGPQTSAVGPQTSTMSCSTKDRGSVTVEDQNADSRNNNTTDKRHVEPSEDTTVNSSSGDFTQPSESEDSHVTGSDGAGLDTSMNPATSTPVADPRRRRPARLAPAGPEDGDSELVSSTGSTMSARSLTEGAFGSIAVPIQGYEVMEERTRFTVYKVAVLKGDKDKWFIFRRYNDFVHLNDQLRELFPHFRLALPPKKWFGDNFDKEFIEVRILGLQAFLNNVVGHRDVCNSEPVRQFFCFDDPPGPHDSLEESKAMCESLEEALYSVKRDLRERDAHISLLEEELALRNAEIDNLRKSLRIERALNTSRLRERASPSTQSQKSENSLPEALMEDSSPGVNSPGGASSGAEQDSVAEAADKLSRVNISAPSGEPTNSAPSDNVNSPGKRANVSKQKRPSKTAERGLAS